MPNARECFLLLPTTLTMMLMITPAQCFSERSHRSLSAEFLHTTALRANGDLPSSTTASPSAPSITMFMCNDSVRCSNNTGCTTTKLPQNTCLKSPGGFGSFHMHCQKSPLGLCASAGRYQDSECKVLVSQDAAVCGTCSMGNSQECHNVTRNHTEHIQAVEAKLNCSNKALCSGNCSAHKAFELHKCESIFPIVDPFVPGPYMTLWSIHECASLVIFEQAFETEDCSGPPMLQLTFPQMFCMNHLDKGFMWKCDN